MLHRVWPFVSGWNSARRRRYEEIEGLKAADGVIQVLVGVEETVCSRSQDKEKRECTCRPRACGNPFGQPGERRKGDCLG
jgi:hypothetical protein